MTLEYEYDWSKFVISKKIQGEQVINSIGHSTTYTTNIPISTVSTTSISSVLFESSSGVITEIKDTSIFTLFDSASDDGLNLMSRILIVYKIIYDIFIILILLAFLVLLIFIYKKCFKITEITTEITQTHTINNKNSRSSPIASSKQVLDIHNNILPF